METENRAEVQENYPKETKGIVYKAGDMLYRWRYLFAVLVFVVCVTLEISGTSIAMWAEQLGVPKETAGDVLGEARLIRSDEWNVSTPLALSQYHSDFSYFSDIVQGSETDMYIVYGQPVLHYSVIFRPFHLGYLFLPPAKGLSFYWCGRFIVLLLVSFELGMQLLKKKRLLSLAYAMMMAASPLVQWWFAINGLVEMLIYGQMAVLLAIQYMKDRRFSHRLVYGALLSMLATAYVLLFYPAWQVPFAYAFLFLLAGVVLDRYEKGTFTKKDFGVLGLSLGLFAAELLPILWKSKDTIMAVMNTAYPGKRVCTGGDASKFMAMSLSNLWLPFDELPNNANVNVASFISFIPLGILLAIFVLAKRRGKEKKNALFLTLLAGIVFLGSYGMFGWPVFLAKATMMSFSQGGRAYIAFSYLNLLLLFYVLSRMEKVKTVWFAIFSGVFSAGIVLMHNFLMDDYWQKDRMLIAGIFVLAICLGIWLQANYQKTGLLFLLCAGVSVVTGMTVNPVHRGLDVIYENDLYKEIERIAENEPKDARWMVCNSTFSMGNFPIMAGAPTINSTNVYPNMERWEKIDSSGEKEEVYNRYAHIWTSVVPEGFEGETFELIFPDLFRLNATPELLNELGVKYLLSGEELKGIDTEDITFEHIYEWNGFYIYRLESEG